MNLLGILKMLCDWKASTLRHHDGNILKGLDYNAERFKIGKQLKRIIQNTIELFE